MQKKYLIYCHTNKINGKKYVGQTCTSAQQRWGKNGQEYIRHQQGIFYKAILKYGWDNFEHEILFTNLTKEEANRLEIETIKKYHSNIGKYGYNITEGGQTNTLTEDQKQKKRQLNYEMWENGTFKEIICLPIYCIELDMEFESALEAERQTGIDNSSIQKVCKNKNSYAGFSPFGEPLHWIYINEKTPEKISQLKNKKEILKGIQIPVQCIETEEIFNSSNEAANKYNTRPEYIRRCIQGKQCKVNTLPQPTHWIERRDLINTKNKISKEKWNELKNG